MKLWMRKVELLAGGKRFDGDEFDIDFKVPFSTKEEPDISEVTIYNLSESTIANIKNEAYVILNAGYGGQSGNILTGKIEEVVTKWNGVTKETKLTVSDGGFEWRGARVQRTYAKGTTSTQIITDLAGILGLGIKEISPNKEIVYQLGRTISGPVEVLLKQIVKDTNSKMFISKGVLTVRDHESGTMTGFLLRHDTGLIDSPEIGEDKNEETNEKIIKYKVKCLLNNAISTDSVIQIESRTVNGSFRVIEGTHNGNFITECTVVPA